MLKSFYYFNFIKLTNDATTEHLLGVSIHKSNMRDKFIDSSLRATHDSSLRAPPTVAIRIIRPDGSQNALKAPRGGQRYNQLISDTAECVFAT